MKILGADHMYFIFLLDIMFLIIGILIAVTLLLVSFGTGLIKKKSLLVVHIVVVSDLLFFVLGTVYLTNLIRHYNGDETNYEPLMFFITAIPVLLFFKGSLILHIGIGFDRLLAAFTPKIYTCSKPTRRAAFYTVLAFLIGVLDVALMFYFSPIIERPRCKAILCFVDEDFQKLWTLSNGIFGGVNGILTVILIIRLVIWKLNAKAGSRGGEEKLMNVNYIAMITLFFSGIFVTLPSLFIAFHRLSDDAFILIAPFYYTTFLIQGFSTSIGLILNKEFNQRLKDCYNAIPYFQNQQRSPPTTSWNRNIQRVHPIPAKVQIPKPR